MIDDEKQFEDFVSDIKFDDNPNYAHRDKLEQDLLSAVWKRPRQINIWRTIMKSRISKLAVAAAVVLVALYLLTGNPGSTAWAIEQTIEALKGYGAVYMTGTVTDEYGAQKPFEMWLRANKWRTFSKDAFLRVTDSGVLMWVKDGSTYTYIPQNNTVYSEDAITAGLAQWPGPIIFKMLARAEGTNTIRGKDPATGREQVTLLSGFITALGPQSYSVKFDVETKLPVEIAQWNNMDRRGEPFFHARQITYYEDLPDSVFAVDYPRNAAQVEKELTIPESSVGLLADPCCGISAEGLSQDDAARLLLKQVYQTLIDDDYNKFRKLCPAASTLSDEFIRYLVNGDDPQFQVVEIVEIGHIFKQGFSKLGTLVALPCVVKTKGGMMAEDKMIVQFRNIGGKSSCVLQGPYGLSREIE
jgi:hypothetical protein